MDLAKVDRTSAKRQLTIAINNLKLTITNEGDAKTVSDRYETVKSKWSIGMLLYQVSRKNNKIIVWYNIIYNKNNIR